MFKFTCEKDVILGALSQISKAIAVKPASPILGGIYMCVTDYLLEIHANNYSLGISAKISINSVENGEVVVIGKKFIEVVRALRSDNAISFEYDDNEHCLNISCGRSSYSIATLNVEDFPKVIQRDAESSFNIKSSVLKSLIKKTVWACVQDDSHPLYSGCLFETEGSTITVVGTNMHRISIAKDKLLEMPSVPLRFIVPVDSLRSIAEMLPEDDTMIIIDYTGKNVSFTIKDTFLTARIIEGRFPDYQKTIPEYSETTVLVDIEDLREALERISIISKEDSNKKVSFEFKKEVSEIYATNADVGSGTETISTSLKGPDLNISFNYTYLIDALKILKEGECLMSMNGQYSALDLRMPGTDDYIYILTPVRG